jgi:hypothetical protein
MQGSESAHLFNYAQLCAFNIELWSRCSPWVTVYECAGSREHSCLTKQVGTRRKGGLSAVPHEIKLGARDGCATQDNPPQRLLHARRFVRGCNICTPGSQSNVGLLLAGPPNHSGLSAHQDLLSNHKVHFGIPQ